MLKSNRTNNKQDFDHIESVGRNNPAQRFESTNFSPNELLNHATYLHRDKFSPLIGRSEWRYLEGEEPNYNALPNPDSYYNKHTEGVAQGSDVIPLYMRSTKAKNKMLTITEPLRDVRHAFTHANRTPSAESKHSLDDTIFRSPFISFSQIYDIKSPAFNLLTDMQENNNPLAKKLDQNSFERDLRRTVSSDGQRKTEKFVPPHPLGESCDGYHSNSITYRHSIESKSIDDDNSSYQLSQDLPEFNSIEHYSLPEEYERYQYNAHWNGSKDDKDGLSQLTNDFDFDSIIPSSERSSEYLHPVEEVYHEEKDDIVDPMDEIDLIFSKVRHNHTDYVKTKLKTLSFNIYARDRNGNTILHICAQNNRYKMAAWILQLYPYDILNAYNHKGYTSLDYSDMYQFTKMSNWLVSQGASHGMKRK